MPEIDESQPTHTHANEQQEFSKLPLDVIQISISSKLAEDPNALWRLMNASSTNQQAVAQYFLGNIRKNDDIFRPTSTTEIALLSASLRVHKDLADKGSLPDGMPPAGWVPIMDLSKIRDKDKVTDELLQDIAKRIPNLTHVNLTGCNKITDVGLMALAEKCPNLTRVNLRGCDEITDAGLIALAANCPNLTSVNLFGCDNLRTEAIQEAYKANPNLVIIGPDGSKVEREQTQVQRLEASRGAVEQTR